MSESTAVSIKVGEDLIKPVIQKQIEAAIIAQLGNGTLLITEAIRYVLTRKVDTSGNYSDSSYGGAKPYIEWLCQETLKGAVKTAVTKWVESHAPDIEAAISKEMKTHSSAFAAAFVDGFKTCLKSEYRTTFEVKFGTIER